MPSTALVDAVSSSRFLNRADRCHERIVELLGEYSGTFLTTWPVVAEACALVGSRRQSLVLAWIDDPDIQMCSIDSGLGFMRSQMSRYADLPCDFADDSLLYAAARTGVRDIWTLDSDFLISRLPDRSRLRVVPGLQP